MPTDSNKQSFELIEYKLDTLMSTVSNGFSRLDNQSTDMQKRLAKLETWQARVEVAHKAALGDSFLPVSFNMTFGVVNGDVIQPYVKVSGGFGGFASAGTMIVRVKNVRQ